MEKVRTTPRGREPNRFTDMHGWTFKPGEPPTRVDAESNLWRLYFNGDLADIPEEPAIAAELERLQKLHLAGNWRR